MQASSTPLTWEFSRRTVSTKFWGIVAAATALTAAGCGGGGPDTAIPDAESGTTRHVCEDWVSASCEILRRDAPSGSVDEAVGEFWTALLNGNRDQDCEAWSTDPEEFAESILATASAANSNAVDEGYARHHVDRYMTYTCTGEYPDE